MRTRQGKGTFAHTCAAWIGAGAVVWGGTALASPEGHRVAAQVDRDSYQFMLDDLMYTHYGDSRGIGGAQHDPARDNIRDQFVSYGLDTAFETFSYSGYTGYNVVGQITGTTRPNEVYIVGAHYDSVDNPGADDNASGVCGVMEIARIVSQYECEATIRFIAFDMEEWGLIGSDRYAEAHRNEDIRGMISLDMIAYDPNSSATANLFGRTASDPIKQAMAAALREYAGYTGIIRGQADYSDHAPFEWRGFQACLLIEYADNPYYHRSNDSVDTAGYINYDYAADLTRGTAGWLTDAAGVLAGCAVDLNGDGVADSQDFTEFLNLFVAGDPAGDFNGDGAVDSRDFIAFLNAFVIGC